METSELRPHILTYVYINLCYFYPIKFILRILFQNSETAAPDDRPESGDESALIVSTYVLRSNLNVSAIITVSMLNDTFAN